jgi:hypothetical protein
LELLAEEGNPSGLVSAAAGGGANVFAFGSVGAAPIMAGSSWTFNVDADASHPWLQYASMLGATNDGFIGSALGFGDQQINLFQGNEPLNADFTLSFLNVWDAGTETNTELMADIPAFGGIFTGPTEGGIVTSPHVGIRGVGNVPVTFDWYGHNVATMSIHPVPEPGTLAVLALGAIALVSRRRPRSQ